MNTLLKTKNISEYFWGKNSLSLLDGLIENRRNGDGAVVYFIDEFFRESEIFRKLPIRENDLYIFVSTVEEPSTDYVDQCFHIIQNKVKNIPSVIIGMGGGCTLDTAKAVSNLLTNGGKAEDYQGWDLVKKPGVFKIGIPTISGTGAEASRTCVMTNKKKNLKLGMNSEYTLFDQLILDPTLSVTVPREQYFYTGLDSYIHCIESLNGQYRHSIADAYSSQVIKLSREIFLSDEDMMSESNREKLMVASYIGGCAIANSYVGVVHPFSAGLSIVLGIHHCTANCLVLNVMNEFYPKETEEFHRFLEWNKISLPANVTRDLSEAEFNRMYDSTIIHEKPLTNALGKEFREILTKEKVENIFRKI